MTTLRDHTESNRRAWNEIAEVRRRQLWPEAAFFAAGGSVLDPRVLEAAGSVRGQRLLHLQCATGEETISWAVAGAGATGVDISEVQIALAERTAAEAGFACRFVASDVYDLPDELQRSDFDLLYTGVGAITWLPDIRSWAKVCRAALRVGGRLVLFDGHPIAACLKQDGELLRQTGNYFGRGTPILDQGWRHFAGGEHATETKVQFVWPLGDIITALCEEGFGILRLEEFPTGSERHLNIETSTLPAEYLLFAERQQ